MAYAIPSPPAVAQLWGWRAIATAPALPAAYVVVVLLGIAPRIGDVSGPGWQPTATFAVLALASMPLLGATHVLFSRIALRTSQPARSLWPLTRHYLTRFFGVGFLAGLVISLATLTGTIVAAVTHVDLLWLACVIGGAGAFTFAPAVLVVDDVVSLDALARSCRLAFSRDGELLTLTAVSMAVTGLEVVATTHAAVLDVWVLPLRAVVAIAAVLLAAHTTRAVVVRSERSVVAVTLAPHDRRTEMLAVVVAVAAAVATVATPPLAVRELAGGSSGTSSNGSTGASEWSSLRNAGLLPITVRLSVVGADGHLSRYGLSPRGGTPAAGEAARRTVVLAPGQRAYWYLLWASPCPQGTVSLPEVVIDYGVAGTWRRSIQTHVIADPSWLCPEPLTS